MKYSQLLIPTIKEVPANAEIPSHQLMLRAGLMRKVASGTYIYLPLGFRCLQKAINIVRQEMNKTGAQEILMPSVQPIELWQKSGRDVDYGETMARFTDRHGRENVLSPTAEEVVTSLAANELKSYKQLPFNLYQISFKFRDEFRPRFGVLRSREFMMKDAYSFHADDESLDVTYKAMYDAYCRIFKRCGLEYVIVQAESGEMGGSGSDQFTIPCENGEDVIVYIKDSPLAWNIEKAPVDALEKQKAIKNPPKPEEVHTPKVGTIEAVCEFLKTKPKDMIKTLIYSCEDQIIIALLRGDHDANPEKITQLLGGKANDLADEATIAKLTGAAVGFAGPVGLMEKADHVLIDLSVAAMAIGITGANKTDYHIKNVVPGRDFKLEGDNIQVADIRNAIDGDTYQGKKLLFKRGIEVGQVFKLGRKYSSKIGAKFLDENGKEQIATMGCYGIGINRIIASAIEAGNDKDGIIFPISIAPFEVIITQAGKDDDIKDAAKKLHDDLETAGIEVLLDDRKERPGVKFKDADLIGIPIRATIGKRSLAEGNVEIKLRAESDSKNVSIEKASEEIQTIVNSLKEKLNI
ncbi:MAG: proline--tRNA ligase [Planctomycetes bacterium]|nr:proline--tRNA ligase [Planctomycetota bacterium]